MALKAVLRAASTRMFCKRAFIGTFLFLDHSSRIVWVRFRDGSLLAIGKSKTSEGGELNRSAIRQTLLIGDAARLVLYAKVMRGPRRCHHPYRRQSFFERPWVFGLWSSDFELWTLVFELCTLCFVVFLVPKYKPQKLKGQSTKLKVQRPKSKEQRPKSQT